ncbi:MAG TPA: energy-coupling factor transporter transmembrane protein EcfT [Firmicutes bacterium]|jgi:energy-coupling factor transport system permease protein|nr:energy-coupling factor transporter transmembrane protein EcfT [Bacillota bacterium]
MSVVVEYIAKGSFVHRLNPLTKLFWSVTLMTLSFFFRDPRMLAGLFFSIVAVAYMAGILKEMWPAFKGLLIVAGLFILFQIFFIADGKTILVLIPGIQIGHVKGIGRITDQGLWGCLAMGARMMVIAASFPVLMGTTKIKDLVVVLVEKLKIPYTYAFMFVTSLRFIPTLMQEMDQIMQAQCSRGHRLDEQNFFKKFLSLCPLAIPLIVTSVKKAERLAISMETRGFGIGARTYLYRNDFRPIDIMVNIALTFILATGLFLNLKGIIG